MSKITSVFSANLSLLAHVNMRCEATGYLARGPYDKKSKEKIMQDTVGIDVSMRVWMAPPPAASRCVMLVLTSTNKGMGAIHMEIATLGIDIAKSVFQLHGVDAAGQAPLRKRLRRNQVLEFMAQLARCLVAIEACGFSHHRAREIAALGHDVRLIPPTYVKPCVKRQKNDMADAEAICEAVTRPNMHFIPIKAPEQQGVLIRHRTRKMLSRQRTMMINALRSHASHTL